MDQEPRPALWKCADAGRVAGARSVAIDRIAGDLFRLLPTGAAVVGPDRPMGADAVALLPEGGAIEFSVLGLCLDDLRFAAVFVAPGAKLVSSQAQETG